MSSKPTLSNTILDNIITRKEARSDTIRRIRARDRLYEPFNLRTDIYNSALQLNAESLATKVLVKNKINDNDFPNHLALVPDGNRTWARARGLSVGEGYAVGSKKLEKFRKWSMIDNNVDVATCFTLSTENIERRPKDELKQLYNVFIEFFNRVPDTDSVHEHRIKHEVRGDSESMKKMPDEVLDSIDKMEKSTEDYSEHKVVFLMPYGGRQDIIQAARQTSNSPLNNAIVTEKGEDNTDFRNNMLLGDLPDVDLMMRTSEKRISNFMLYETAYSELVFYNKTWPSFSHSDFLEGIYKYSNRSRNFGV